MFMDGKEAPSIQLIPALPDKETEVSSHTVKLKQPWKFIEQASKGV